MGRPAQSTKDIFTSREIALAGGLSGRSFAFLLDQELAPTALNDGLGKAGHRTYGPAAVGHAALIGALNLAGLELLVSARLSALFADNFVASHLKLPSNLNAFLHGKFNPTKGLPWGPMPEDLPLDFEQDYWLHHLLRNRSPTYQRSTAVTGDCVVEIADNKWVLTRVWGSNLKIHSPVSRDPLPASPECRIEGRGSSVRIVPIHQEVDSCDFQLDPRSAKKMQELEREYIDGQINAVTIVRINLSLAIRNAFDRLQDDRDRKIAA